MIIKGTSFLNWSIFEHQKGTIIVGNANENYMETLLSKTERPYKQWKHQQAYWIKNIDNLLSTLKVILEKDIKKVSVEAMIDSGLWEKCMWFPVALCAESMWNPYEDSKELIRKVSLVKEVYFA